MSQILRIQRTRMMVREHLEQALQDLGFEWENDRRLFLLGPRVDIKIKGHSAGFREAEHGYELLQREAGVDLKKLIPRYAYHAARAKLEAQGFSLAREEVQQDGQIHLVLRRMT